MSNLTVQGGNVFSIQNGRALDSFQEDIIGTLEWLLVEARSGQLKAFAYAAVATDGLIATNWKGHIQPVQLAGAVSILSHEIVEFIKSRG